ncbi:aquaporin-11 [Melanerpes formicivorus]|uniref:aquaporin-11 n=1 Tax=Melanerpes formicivorus TaxID=211600 RepID=UPI00358FE404
MAVGGVGTSLLLMAGIMVAVGLCRRVTRRRLRTRQRLCTFLLEMFSTFQICACTNELCLLGNVEPKPHTALTLTYGFTVLHGLTLPGSTCNPCGTLQPMWGGGTSVRVGGLKIAAQFLAAVLARVFMHFIWSLEMAEPHSGALSQGCSNPMQTTEVQAFCIELLFSVVFQLTILRVERINPKYKVHLIAFLITMLVYAGGNLTGAVFNPALALSLHPSCFYDRFLSYSLVYWIAPSLGTMLVAFIWDGILPRLS